MGVEDDVLGLDVPVDDVPRVQIREGLEELKDASGRRRRIGRRIPEPFRERVAFEVFLDEAERPQVRALVDVPHDPGMSGTTQGPQDLRFNPKPFLGLSQIHPARFLHDDRLPALGFPVVNGGHPAVGELADDLIAPLPAFQRARKS